MLTSFSKQHLISFISDEQIANDIEKRLLFQAYANYQVPMAKIREYLEVAIANKEHGDFLASTLQQAELIKYEEVAGVIPLVPEVPAVAAQFIGQVAGMTTDVTIDADVAGIAGNVTLIADSITDIDGLIAAWNLANVGNELTLSAGIGTQIPTADIDLAGGADLIPEVPASNPTYDAAVLAFSQTAFSANFKEWLIVAMANREAALEVDALHTALLVTIAAL